MLGREEEVKRVVEFNLSHPPHPFSSIYGRSDMLGVDEVVYLVCSLRVLFGCGGRRGMGGLLCCLLSHEKLILFVCLCFVYSAPYLDCAA